MLYSFIKPNIQKNSINRSCMGPDVCRMIKYYGLSDGTLTGIKSYGNFLLLLHLDSTIDQRSVSFGCFHHLLVEGHQGPVCGSLHSCSSWCSRVQGIRRYCNGSCTNTLRGFCEHVHQICLFHWCSFFLWKAKLPVLGLLSSSVRLLGFLNYWM